MPLLEITDLLWPVDDHGRRLPARKDPIVATLREAGDERAARIVARMPATGGILDEAYVDALAVRVHCELQRLGEELQFGRRAAALLAPVTSRLVAEHGSARVVDVGCGLGFVVRWLAATGDLGPDVELVGLDLNPVLVDAASALARREGLTCRFVHADAFAPGPDAAGPDTVVISSGVLHHFPASDLPGFFALHEERGVAGFAHWDIPPSRLATIGAWVFHRARMREPVSRHDGVVSARRAHPTATLLEAARAGAPSYDVEVVEGTLRWLDAVRPVVGWRR